MERSWYKGLNATEIKIIALIIMTVDHVASYGTNIPFTPEAYSLLRQIGRVAAPLFLFAFTESMRHTKNRKAMFLRLYIASVVLGLINAVLGYLMGYKFGNIFQTFAWIAFTVFTLDALLKDKKLLPAAALAAAVLFSVALDKFICSPLFDFKGAALLIDLVRAFLCSPIQVDYSLGMIFLGVLWYYLPNKEYCGGLLLLLCIPAFLGFTHHPELIMFSGAQYAMAPAAFIIMMYNGEKGRGMKNFFYIYYPVHVYIIAVFNKLCL